MARKVSAIVLDLDDTILSFLSFLLSFYNTKNNSSISEVDITEWDFEHLEFEDSINSKKITGEDIKKVFKDYEDHGLYVALPPIPQATHAIELMRLLGYRIIILTGRNEKYRKDTELSLTINKIPFDELVLSAQKDKEIIRLSKKYNLVAFVDDNPKNIKDVLNTDKVDTLYLMDRVYNRNILPIEDVIRVRDLIEIIRSLKDLRR
jgi:uncharacterized HAD superfamily protein